MPEVISQTTLFADLVGPSLRASIGYADLLVKDIPPDQFAHSPHPTLNHPAFNIGHLSLYPNRVLTLLGMQERVVEKPGFPELFKAGVKCVEQDGRYPAKDEIVAYFQERHRALADALPEVEEDVLRRPNPAEGRFRDMFPTAGAVATFMSTAHLMSHLGQVSAWRRVMRLPPVM